jgi:hypothetical protein
MCYDSPARDLNVHLLAQYMANGTIVPGTSISRMLKMGLNPVKCAFNKLNTCYDGAPYVHNTDGIVDSLKCLLQHEHFIKPYSDEYTLVKLLTRAF